MLEFAHIGLSIIMASLIIIGFSRGVKKSTYTIDVQQKKIRAVIFTLIGWFAYLSVLSKTEFLFDTSLPPRVFIFLVLPLIIFCFWFYIKNKNSVTLKNIPTHWLIGYQTFRIPVELILLFSFQKMVIPESATFEGYNFDIIWGVSAPLIAYLAFKGRSKLLIKVWNIIGIIMVLNVAFIISTSMYLPTFWNSEVSLVSSQFFTLPYLLVAGFLAPSAILIHVVTQTKLRK